VSSKIVTKNFIPAFAWHLLSLILVCIPGNRLPKMDNWFDLLNFDKLIHTGLFGGVAGFYMLPILLAKISKSVKLRWFQKISLASALWSISLEFLQTYVPKRSCDPVDMVANVLGVIIAYLLFRFLLKKYF
jgi:glycopeptide antibiotics resistance protein